ncbi:MAG: undecaprenyl-phosphate galactose phosphotransferase WbaP [Planctomycetota bacterium]
MIVDEQKLRASNPESRLGHRFLDGVQTQRMSLSDFADPVRFPSYWRQVLANSIPLVMADLVALTCSVFLVTFIAKLAIGDAALSPSWVLVLTAPIVPIIFTLFRLYPGTGIHAVAELSQIGMATVSLISLALVSSFIKGTDFTTTATLIGVGFCLTALAPPLRAITRRFASRFSWWGQPVILFGGGETAIQLYRYYRSKRHLGLQPIAILDEWSQPDELESCGDFRTHPASREQWEAVQNFQGVYWAIVCTPLSTQTAAAVRRFSGLFPHVLVVPTSENLPNSHRELVDCGRFHGILMTNTLLLPLPRLLKSFMDRVLVVLGGLITLPLIAIIGTLIKLTSPGPVFYAQRRLGKNGKPFWAWKFRTMVPNADEVLESHLNANPELRSEWERDHKLKNDPRVSAIGYWLRKTSLDELPQTWNVLRGEMSLVGPRPIVEAEIPKYGAWYELYQRTTPGITGMWQISGRNNTTYEFRVANDSYYVLNWSPWLDLYILARTIKVVLRCEGAY